MADDPMDDLREALANASPATLERIAADIAPLLFKNDYQGEAAGTGDDYGDAVAVSRSPALPPFLVRVYRGTFSDVQGLFEAMRTAGVSQAALAVIATPPMTPITRNALGNVVPWLLDTEGLAHMMLSANIGINVRTYEVKSVDRAYFR